MRKHAFEPTRQVEIIGKKEMGKSEDDEIVDYMDDSYLEKLKNEEEKATNEKISKKSKKRERPIEKTQMSKKTASKLAKDRLIKGLDTEISSDNIGFKLLSKMGFSKAGNDSKMEEKNEPLKPHFNPGRSGIGSVLETKKDVAVVIPDTETPSNVSEESIADFTARSSKVHSQKRIAHDIIKLKPAIVDLDSRNTENSSRYREEFEISEADLDPSLDINYYQQMPVTKICELLQKLVSYSRKIHFYCNWCGLKYEDIDDLNENCPGPTYEDHQD
jgi:hypothetical protein